MQLQRSGHVPRLRPQPRMSPSVTARDRTSPSCSKMRSLSSCSFSAPDTSPACARNRAILQRHRATDIPELLHDAQLLLVQLQRSGHVPRLRPQPRDVSERHCTRPHIPELLEGPQLFLVQLQRTRTRHPTAPATARSLPEVTAATVTSRVIKFQRFLEKFQRDSRSLPQRACSAASSLASISFRETVGLLGLSRDRCLAQDDSSIRSDEASLAQ